MCERANLEVDGRHPMHGQVPPKKRLKSRKGFLDTVAPLTMQPQEQRLQQWNAETPLPSFAASEKMATGHELPYPVWKTLNRIRAGTGRTNVNLVKWGLQDNPHCECGKIQDDEHLLACPLAPSSLPSRDDLLGQINEVTIRTVEYWLNKGI